MQTNDLNCKDCGKIKGLFEKHKCKSKPPTSNKEKSIEEVVEELIDEQFGLNSKYGSYIYHLTRDKQAFEIGTMTLDDFMEIDCDDEWLGELKIKLNKALTQARQAGAEEAKSCNHEIEICGSSNSKGNVYTMWQCTKCFIQVKELGLERCNSTSL